MDFVGSPIFSGILSLIAAALALASFFNQFLRRFAPKVFISPTVYFSYEISDPKQRRKHPEYRISHLTLEFSLSNTRNAYGHFQDVAVVFYRNDSINPRAIKWFVTEQYESYEDSQHHQRGFNWHPLTLAPKTFTKRVLVFRPDHLISSPTININHSYSLAVYGKHSSKRRWKKEIETILFCETTQEKQLLEANDIRGTHLTFSTLRLSLTRENTKSQFGRARGRAYEGWWDYKRDRFKIKIRARISRLLKLPLVVIGHAISSIGAMIDHLFTNTIRLRTVKNSITLKQQFGFRDATWDRDKEVQKGLDEIESTINELLHSHDNSKTISLTKTKNGIELSRNRFSLKIYKSGGPTIYAIDPSRSDSSVNFKLGLKKSPFGGFFWQMNNKRICIRSAAIRIFDAFSFRSAR